MSFGVPRVCRRERAREVCWVWLRWWGGLLAEAKGGASYMETFVAWAVNSGRFGDAGPGPVGQAVGGVHDDSSRPPEAGDTLVLFPSTLRGLLAGAQGRKRLFLPEFTCSSSKVCSPNGAIG